MAISELEPDFGTDFSDESESLEDSTEEDSDPSLHHTLLTAAQERFLGITIRFHRRNGSFLISKILDSNLSDEVRAANFELLVTLETLADEAKKEFVIHNQKLAKKFAFRTYRRNAHRVRMHNSVLEIEDLRQEGTFGLYRAAEGYDPDRNRFSTYAVWWINQSTQRAIDNQLRTIRLPVHFLDFMKSVSKERIKLNHKLGAEPDDQQIADSLDIKVEEIRLATQFGGSMDSLDRPLSEDSDETLGDFIPSKDQHTEKAGIENAISDKLKDALDEMVANKTLKPRHVTVILTHYGIIGDTGILSLEDTAKQIDSVDKGKEGEKVSRERIRQLETEAFRRLRNSPQFQKFRECLD